MRRGNVTRLTADLRRNILPDVMDLVMLRLDRLRSNGSSAVLRSELGREAGDEGRPLT